MDEALVACRVSFPRAEVGVKRAGQGYRRGCHAGAGGRGVRPTGGGQTTGGGRTDVGRAPMPTPHSSQEPGRRRGSPVQLSDLSAVDPLSKEREDDVSLTGLVEADRATHVQPDTVLPCGDRDVVGSQAPRQAVADLPYVN